MQLRRKERYSKFGVYKVIPIKKTFRQSNNLFWLILIFSLMLFFYIYKTNNSEESYKPAMGIVVYSIFIFGYFVKFSLSLFFPELILNGNGIKFIGKKSIDWKEIKKIKALTDKPFASTIMVNENLTFTDYIIDMLIEEQIHAVLINGLLDENIFNKLKARG